MGFGKQLGIVLEELVVSVSELSKATGIPATTIYSMIDRDTDSVGIDKVKKIEHALGIKPGSVLYNLLYGITPEENEISTRQIDFYSLSSGKREALLNDFFNHLNIKGQVKVLEYTEDMSKVPEYCQNLSRSKK